MKTTQALILTAGLAGMLATASAQTQPAPDSKPPAATPEKPAQPDKAAPTVAAQAKTPASAPAAVAPAASTPAPAAPKAPVERVTSDTQKGMRLNFRGVPLEMVLDYFSEAAGFVIIPKTDIRGRVDVWSNEPLTKDEAVEVLNNVLSQNGYAAIRTGRTLMIVSKEEAQRRSIPTKSGADPEKIPATEEMVTQIIPVKFISASQLIRNLEQLLPTSSNLSANDGANALVITDVQANIHRVAEIIKALDTPISSVSSLKVFTLKYADAKALSTVLRDLFQPPDQTGGGRGGTGTSPFQQLFQGRGGFGGGGGGGGGFGGFGGAPGGDTTGGGAGRGSRGGSGNTGRVSTPRVVAAADELTNSLIVSAPEDQMPLIEDLVKQVDVPVEDVTELRVFTLKYSNPSDMADMLKNLFPDLSSNNQNTRNSFRGGFTSRFGGFGGPGGGGGGTGGSGGASASGDQSNRQLKQNRVVAVADLRTRSVIVSAAPVLMQQIAGMIEQIDSDSSKDQKVFVIPIENSDPVALQNILQSLFPSQNGTSSRSSSQNNRGTSTGVGGTGNSFGRGSTTGGSGGTGFGGGGSGFGSSGGLGGGSGFGGTRN